MRSVRLAATRAVLALTVSFIAGCQSFSSIQQPKTLAEEKTSYSYIPLDPLPVLVSPGANCSGYPPKNYKALLNALPDQAVRIAVGQYDSSGTLTFGPIKTGIENHSYQIILDYIGVDTTNIPVYVERFLVNEKSGKQTPISIYDESGPKDAHYVYLIHRDPASSNLVSFFGLPFATETSDKETKKPNGDLVIVPVYVGVGLRLTASITVLKGEVNLSSLGSIAAGAQAGNLTGSLVVQTLGVTGKSVATSLPLPSELSQSTVQNAILALGSIKAILYDANTEITPRVVGIYNPIGGGQRVVNGIISILSRYQIVWRRPCLLTNEPSQSKGSTLRENSQ